MSGTLEHMRAATQAVKSLGLGAFQCGECSLVSALVVSVTFHTFYHSKVAKCPSSVRKSTLLHSWAPSKHCLVLVRTGLPMSHSIMLHSMQ